MTAVAMMTTIAEEVRGVLSDHLTKDEMSQLPLVLCGWGGIIFVHTIMNQMNIKKPSHSLWFEKGVHYAVILGVLLFFMTLDSQYPDIRLPFATFKGPIGGYALGLVDFYFSALTKVRVSTCQWGLILFTIPFCACTAWITHLYGRSITVVTFSSMTIPSLLWAYARLFVFIILGGPTADVFFNPLHRIEHAASSYKQNHKHHHMYVKDLCGLVAYFGTVADTFIMGASISGGLVLQILILQTVGLFDGYLCTLMYYTFWCLVTYAHSHNQDLASLIVPVPEEQNFIAYHRKHHLDPNCNMGASPQGDKFWDWVLGQKTVSKPL
eukprot:TRINITY_DN1420_c0_g2_i2.p1 TRINITY_DN1420_c0_g2~~TRINITY_DN1420_c0_g2_i2.p1  ORF type:complete len:324 (+),score=51.78 TRINITY_DN1420_c0_g2_i2:809-1780(+)